MPKQLVNSPTDRARFDNKSTSLGALSPLVPPHTSPSNDVKPSAATVPAFPLVHKHTPPHSAALRSNSIIVTVQVRPKPEKQQLTETPHPGSVGLREWRDNIRSN